MTTIDLMLLTNVCGGKDKDKDKDFHPVEGSGGIWWQGDKHYAKVQMQGKTYFVTENKHGKSVTLDAHGKKLY